MLQLSPDFNTINSLVTPAQFQLLNRPEVKALLEAFDLQPVKQKEVILNEKISLKIDSWLAEFSDINFVAPPPKPPAEIQRVFKAWKSVAGKSITCHF